MTLEKGRVDGVHTNLLVFARLGGFFTRRVQFLLLDWPLWDLDSYAREAQPFFATSNAHDVRVWRERLTRLITLHLLYDRRVTFENELLEVLVALEKL